MVTVEGFSGGRRGIAPGACGLFTVFGRFQLPAAIEAAAGLQYRATSGSGLTLKGMYQVPPSCYVLHIMYRDPLRVEGLEDELRRGGFTFYGDPEPLVHPRWFQLYDMPVMKRYKVLLPPEEERRRTEHVAEPEQFISRKVTELNLRHKDHARIFSSAQDSGTFVTAFDLKTTLAVFDIEQYDSPELRAAQFHMRWPTSMAAGGLWWGAQPIAVGRLSGTHNGHLSSDRSNAFALQQLGIEMHVGTDSEGIFREVHYLLERGLTIREIEWVMARRFPDEVALMSEEERTHYRRLTRDPILTRFKMSGPSTAILLIGDLLVGLTDRDHLRAFAVGCCQDTVLMASEECAVLTAAYLMGKNVSTFNPDAGEVVMFRPDNGAVRRMGDEESQ